jgi:hypothetical protein
METIIKLPLYLKIDTLENVDRSKISNLAKAVIIPEVLKMMKKGFSLNRLFSPEDLTYIVSILGKGAEIDLLTEVQAMAKKGE